MATFKAVHLADDNVYLIVERPWGMEFEVDGLPAPRDKDFTVQSVDQILKVTRHTGEVLNFRDAEGNTITATEHERQRLGLLEGSHEDDDDRIFLSLDAEFEYRKFCARWSVGDRAADVVTKQPVEWEIVEVRVNSGDPDIVSLWNAPHVRRDATLYSFNRDAFMVRLCRQLCEEAGLAYKNGSGINENGADRGYLRFAKIDGEYAFDTTFDESKGPFIGTRQDCATEKDRCRERVASVVRVRAIKKSGKQLANAGEVVIALQDVLRRLAGVYTKGKGNDDALGMAKKRLGDLITSIVGEA